MSTEEKPAYGGLAVIEGVMFAGKHSNVTAIRRNNRQIDFYKLEKKERAWVKPLKKIPFIRGNVALVQASANGNKHMSFASDRYEVDPQEDDKIEPAKKESKLALIFGVAIIGIISFIVGQIIFTAVPALMAHSLFRSWFPGHIEQNIIEGIIKTIILLIYIYIISLTPLIKRLFQYHGAEHKVINCYENNLPLTVENVQKSSRLHYRCGSSFILLTVIVGVFVYLFFPTEPLWERILWRLLLIPVVIGISYEALQLTNKLRDIPVLKYLGYPGLAVQLLTTKEPTNDQVEVAITSFERMLEYDAELAGGSR